MIFRKEQLEAISGLILPDTANDMSDNQFDEYAKALVAFTESFPNYETELKKSFAAGDCDTFSKNLFHVRDVLEKIKAIGLMQSCRRLLAEFDAKKHEIVEAHLTYLLAEMAALSIDIQMARHTFEASNKTDAKMEPDLPVKKNEKVRQKTILAVDDISFLLSTLKSFLQNTEYNFTGVTSGEVALRYIEKHKPDLFILDIEMPGMNGYELAEKIRSSGQTAPIIFLTGNVEQEYVIKAIKAGAADFIVKPVNKEYVLEKIQKHIGE